jgi:Domain of unknown function (DUF4360)
MLMSWVILQLQFTRRYEISGPDFQGGSNFAVPSSMLTPDNLWSQCGGDDMVSVNFRVALTGDNNASGEIKEYPDQAAANGPHHSFKLVWRNC